MLLFIQSMPGQEDWASKGVEEDKWKADSSSKLVHTIPTLLHCPWPHQQKGISDNEQLWQLSGSQLPAGHSPSKMSLLWCGPPMGHSPSGTPLRHGGPPSMNRSTLYIITAIFLSMHLLYHLPMCLFPSCLMLFLKYLYDGALWAPLRAWHFWMPWAVISASEPAAICTGQFMVTSHTGPAEVSYVCPVWHSWGHQVLMHVLIE